MFLCILLCLRYFATLQHAFSPFFKSSGSHLDFHLLHLFVFFHPFHLLLFTTLSDPLGPLHPKFHTLLKSQTYVFFSPKVCFTFLTAAVSVDLRCFRNCLQFAIFSLGIFHSVLHKSAKFCTLRGFPPRVPPLLYF